MVKENPKLVKYLNALQINWFEYQSGVSLLTKLGVNNAQVLPNCKKLNPIEKESITKHSNKVFEFCTFSRVMPEKGIDDAIEAVHKINALSNGIIVKLDIYGPIEESYKKEFFSKLENHKNEICYKGIIESSQSVETLKNYFMLLFPTRWHGEGFPGTILDCYASALPIIASDINANKEIIKHQKTGIIYPNKGFNNLYECILWAINNKNEIYSMKYNCIDEYDNYTFETIGNIICKEIRGF